MMLTAITREFDRRVSEIPSQGIGLSVDLYTPDLHELVAAIQGRRLPFGYLEIFKASERALAEARQRLAEIPMAYHAEGLWVTQPHLCESLSFEIEVETAAAHLKAIRALWLTHECATKQMVGYSFGTYLPPLFTEASAAVTARNVRQLQQRLDTQACHQASGRGPLMLLETPPLTYFGLGDIRIADFFRTIATQASCGIVLDIGHLWTVYRYSGEWKARSIARFLDDFLEHFPMERVVQIHIAGLGMHAHDGRAGHPDDMSRSTCPPLWIDAHAQPIPPVLFEMLEQVLAHPRLVNLRGVALEVDNKPIAQIVHELEIFSERFGQSVSDRGDQHVESVDPEPSRPGAASPFDESEAGPDDSLMAEYVRYAEIVTGKLEPTPGTWLDADGLAVYRRSYLPNEILTWGGQLQDMFPESCRRLAEESIPLDDFVDFWFREPRPAEGGYDFFLLKIERFVAYVSEVCPEAAHLAHREAQILREGYAVACG